MPGHGLRLGYYAQEHETLDVERTVLEHMRSAAPASTDGELRRILGAFLFSGETSTSRPACSPAARRPGWRWPRWSAPGANVLLLDEPTNNLDPVSPGAGARRDRTLPGAIVLVTHDPGAVAALKPERVILLPDGDEDAWSDDLLDLVELA